MTNRQQVMEIPPSCVLLVNIGCKGCVKKINKLFEKIDRKHGTHTSIAPQQEQGKAQVTVTGNIDKAILFKKLKTINKIPELINPVHEDKGSSSTSIEAQQPNPNKNSKDNKNAALVTEKNPADSEKKEEKNKGKEIEEIEEKEEKNKGKEIEERKKMGQVENRAPMGPMNSHLVGQMGGHPTGQMIYGHPMGDRFDHSQIPQQRQHFSSIFDDDNANGCSIV